MPGLATLRAQEQEVLELEQRAQDTAATGIEAQITAVSVAVLALWLNLSARGAQPGETIPDFAAERVLELYDRLVSNIIVPDNLSVLLAAVTRESIALGAHHALDWLGEPDRTVIPLDPDLAEFLGRIRERTVRPLVRELAGDGLIAPVTRAQVDQLIARPRRVPRQLRQDVGWVVNRAVNTAVVEVASQETGLVMWWSERDACLHCLALSGTIVPAGQVFPRVTWADRPLTLPQVDRPPLHPNCRCRIVPYRPVVSPDPDTDLSQAARREAQRSVARGWSGSDSRPARLRAADRLLRTTTSQLPRSVLERAARDVRRGRFDQAHRPRTTLRA